MALHKQARTVAQTGLVPKWLYGSQALGIAAKEVDEWWSVLACTAGLNQGGRCRTMTLAISLGHLGDPGVKAYVEQVKAWLQIWRRSPQHRGEVLKA